MAEPARSVSNRVRIVVVVVVVCASCFVAIESCPGYDMSIATVLLCFFLVTATVSSAS